MDELSNDEKRYLRALELFYEAQGRKDITRKLAEQPPHMQRLSITMYHQWLEHPEEFGAVYKWVFSFLPLIRVFVWAKSLMLKTKGLIQRALHFKD